MELKCPPAPSNKKEYIAAIGKALVQEHGTKKYYRSEEVKKASEKTKHNNPNYIDWHCWAMCVFTCHEDFDAYHTITGEICDYTVMRIEMLRELSTNSILDWLPTPDLDLDASWLDFGKLFDGVLEGIGDFISGIFDGL